VKQLNSELAWSLVIGGDTMSKSGAPACGRAPTGFSQRAVMMYNGVLKATRNNNNLFIKRKRYQRKEAKGHNLASGDLDHERWLGSRHSCGESERKRSKQNPTNTRLPSRTLHVALATTRTDKGK